jgi:hypothetical protein
MSVMYYLFMCHMCLKDSTGTDSNSAHVFVSAAATSIKSAGTRLHALRISGDVRRRSDATRTVLLTGLQHAREWVSGMVPMVRAAPIPRYLKVPCFTRLHVFEINDK